MSDAKKRAVEAIAKWIYKWYQGGSAWCDLTPYVQERYKQDADDILSLPELAAYFKEMEKK